jgi:hypothetical protein
VYCSGRSQINVYVEPATETSFSRAIVGLIYLRTTGVRSQHLDVARRLRAHLLSIGHDVPIFELTNEQPGQIDMWSHGVSVDIRAHPYNLAVVEA